MKRFFSLSFWISQLSKNHINVFLTLWFNFHFLPFKQAIRMPFFLYGKVRIVKAEGKISIDAPVKKGMISINKIKSSPCVSGYDTEIVLHKNGQIIFKGSAVVGCGCCLNVNIGKLLLGDGVRIGNQNNIGCFNLIQIGNNTRFGHQNQLYDTNFHHIVDLSGKKIKRSNAPIVIGDNCWISNRCTIMPGICMPNGTIVSSNSLINKNVATAEHQIIGGIPAKLLKENMIRVWNPQKECELHFFFRDNPTDLMLDSVDEYRI